MKISYMFRFLLIYLSTVLLLCACQDLIPSENKSTTQSTSIELGNSSLDPEASDSSHIKVDSHPDTILTKADNLKWEYSAKLLANTVLLANDDMVVILSDDAQIGGMHEASYIIGLDANSGATLWSIEVSFKSFVVHADTLFILEELGNGEYKLAAYNTRSGSQIWASTYSRIVESQQLFIVQDYLYLKVKYDENNSGLFRIHVQTGITEEECPMNPNIYVYSNGKHLFFVDTNQGEIQSLDLTFNVIWKIDSIDYFFLDSNYEGTPGIIAYIHNSLCYVDLATRQIKKYQIENKDKSNLIDYIKANGTESKYRYCDDFIVYDDWLSMIIGKKNYLLSTTNSEAIISNEDERIFLIGQDIIAYKSNMVTCKPLNCSDSKWKLELTADFKVMNKIVSYKDMLILWVSNGYVLCDKSSGNIIKQVLYKNSEDYSIEFYPRSYVFNPYKSEKFLFLPKLFGLECYSLS